jgi:glycosyltransferase involved in cell wall biosynthesis
MIDTAQSPRHARRIGVPAVRRTPSFEPATAADPHAVANGLPSVGVVIPTRDRPDVLARALRAVLAQDYPGDIRVIVVYDGTPPDYLLARALPRPVMVLANWRAPGLAGTRNTGVLGLDTDLVAFCDDTDEWRPEKITAQVAAINSHPSAEFVTCAIEVDRGGRCIPRFTGTTTVHLADLVRSRANAIRSSTFLMRREALLGGLGLVAEDAPGGDDEDWDLLLRAAKRATVVHIDEPLVRVPWRQLDSSTYGYATRISSLRWMMARHPEIRGCRPGAAHAYGQLACWSAASGNRRDAWYFGAKALRNNWREPRAAIAMAATAGVVRVDRFLDALDRRASLGHKGPPHRHLNRG